MGATMGGKGFNTALGGVMTGMVAVIDAMANMAHSRKESMVFLGGVRGFARGQPGQGLGTVAVLARKEWWLHNEEAGRSIKLNEETT